MAMDIAQIFTKSFRIADGDVVDSRSAPAYR